MSCPWSDVGGKAFKLMSTTVQSGPIQTMSRGKPIPFIQNLYVPASSKTKSIAVAGGNEGRPDKPFCRWAGETAISTGKRALPTITPGPTAIFVEPTIWVATAGVVAVARTGPSGVGEACPCVGVSSRVTEGTGGGVPPATSLLMVPPHPIANPMNIIQTINGK